MHTLLITDDHLSVLQTLDFAFRSDRLRVLSAIAGPAALELWERETVDAALIDLHMPVMDGLTLTRALKERASAAGRLLPIWIMTAAPSAVAVEQARVTGAEGMLRKPFDAAAFYDQLLRKLGGVPDRKILPPDLAGPREVLHFAGSGPPPDQ
jgi:CheY-like chemotaxis protein